DCGRDRTTMTPIFPYTTLFRSFHLRATGESASPKTMGNESPKAQECTDAATILEESGLNSLVEKSIGRQLLETVAATEPIGRKLDRKSTRLNSSHEWISYAVFC